MPSKIFRHTARLFSLFLAIHMLGLGVGVSIIQTKGGLEASEAKSLITAVLDIELDLKQTDLGSGDCSKEAECETSSDTFDGYHFSHSLNLDHYFSSSLHSNHAHLFSIKGCVMDITSPPPKS